MRYFTATVLGAMALIVPVTFTAPVQDGEQKFRVERKWLTILGLRKAECRHRKGYQRTRLGPLVGGLHTTLHDGLQEAGRSGRDGEREKGGSRRGCMTLL